MKKISYLIFFLTVSLGTYAFGCFKPKASQIVKMDVLVKRTANIILAKVLSVDANNEFSFQVISSLKGKSTESFKLKGTTSSENINNHYNNHQEKQFWTKDSEGRADISPMCVISAGFEVGKTYLIFLDQPYHFKSFELINDEKADVWLTKVKNEIMKQRKK